MNLLNETIWAINDSNHKIEDIIFIGSEESGHQCTWDEFKILSDYNYNESYGAQEVATDLIIVFKDGSKMWRDEYDGSECWSYSKPFKKPKNNLKIKSLFGQHCNKIGWVSLSEINGKNHE